jgi:two-component sensor histidine kinase
LSRIDFAQYVTELSASLLKSFEQSKPIHKVRIDIPNGLMGIDVAIPCGLIINELVSNSLKYAFPDGRHGEIHISLHTYGNQMTLSVTDDGVGIPETLDLHTIDSLGLRLVNTLASQIGGSMDVQRNNGTSTVITFESPHSR